MGVCALITPWKFPLMILGWKLAPALATGNTVVIKPAEQTPLTSIRLAELAQQVGFPPGVVNLVTGDGAVGAALVEHPDVDKVSFTGSTEVGRSIVRGSAGNFKRVTLDSGGKAPSAIARDADVDAAVGGNLGGALLNSGQVCAAYTRFYVDARPEDFVLTKMAAAVEAMTIGPGLEQTTQLGPLVSAQHLDKVSQMVAAGQAEGAELVTGGKRARDVGYFLQPTIFSGVTDAMSIATDEIFGPVLSVFRYSDEEQLQHLIDRANDTPYGLAATIWTKDLTAAHRLANGIRAGTIWVNPSTRLRPGAGSRPTGCGDGPVRDRRLHRGQGHLHALRRMSSMPLRRGARRAGEPARRAGWPARHPAAYHALRGTLDFRPLGLSRWVRLKLS